MFVLLRYVVKLGESSIRLQVCQVCVLVQYISDTKPPGHSASAVIVKNPVIITVMLNLFQHLSFQCIYPEIPKQVRNDRESSSIAIASPSLSVILRDPDSSGNQRISLRVNSAKQSKHCMLAHPPLRLIRYFVPRNDSERAPYNHRGC